MNEFEGLVVEEENSQIMPRYCTVALIALAAYAAAVMEAVVAVSVGGVFMVAFAGLGTDCNPFD